jgi:Flp pilus assembly protein TadG
MRSARHSERGASLAETAIVMTVLLLLLFGIIDFARMTYTYSFLANTARMGARWMIVRGSQSCTSGNGVQIDNCSAGSTALLTYVKSLDVGVLNPNNISLNSTPTFSACPGSTVNTNAPGCTVTVTVSYPFSFLALSNFAQIQMSSTSKMVISQ